MPKHLEASCTVIERGISFLLVLILNESVTSSVLLILLKARAHKGGMRIGKTPKKLDSICCPQYGETKADTLKATEANRRRGPGTREKVSSRRINLEGNTHAQEINASQLPV
jgi:hypothetical protein